MKPEDFGIKNYEWVDGKLNVKGNVNLHERGLKKLPFNFGVVGGNFYCSKNKLTSLDGAPKKVGGDFYCFDNQLTSLQGAPKEVGGDFHCSDNRLTSLQGAPKKVGRDFICSDNQLTSLKGVPLEMESYNEFVCGDNPLSPLELIKTLFFGGKLPEKFEELADKIEPDWENLLKLQGLIEESDDDLLKALEKVSK